MYSDVAIIITVRSSIIKKIERHWSKLFINALLQHLAFTEQMNQQMEMKPDWSGLPSELLETIATKLSRNFVDIIRFGAVCTSWQSISQLHKSKQSSHKHHANCVPWLLLSSHETKVTHRAFLSLSENMVYWLDLPTPSNVTFCGSSNGWLVVMDETLKLSLLNPITKTQFHLPPLTSIPRPHYPYCYWLMQMQEELLIHKAVVVSSSTTPNDVSDGLIIILCSCLIVFCKLGDINWSSVSLDYSEHDAFDDVGYSEGKLYAVTSFGSVWVYDIFVPVTVQMRPKDQFRADKNYLVEASGEFLLVKRFRVPRSDFKNAYRTNLFQVFKINGSNNASWLEEMDCDEIDWVELRSLGDRALFLGHNHSLSLLASDFSGIKPNCIYFTDNSINFADNISKHFLPMLLYDVGIFNLEDGCVEKLTGYSYDLHLALQPPMWMTTSPW